MTKYNNKKIEIDGCVFDSKAEARRYQELVLWVRSGEISELQLHPKYKVVVNQRNICTYIADFCYKDSRGKIVVEDVKGVKTPVYQLKKKLVFACYGIEIQEVM